MKKLAHPSSVMWRFIEVQHQDYCTTPVHPVGVVTVCLAYLPCDARLPSIYFKNDRRSLDVSGFPMRFLKRNFLESANQISSRRSSLLEQRVRNSTGSRLGKKFVKFSQAELSILLISGPSFFS